MHEDHSLIHGIGASHESHWVVVKWKYRGEPCEVIVLKSEEGYADHLKEIFADDPSQHAIYFDTGTQCQDQDIYPGVKYYYTLFAQDPDGNWQREGHEHAKVREDHSEHERIEFHPEGTFMRKLDTLRVGLFEGSMGGPI